MGKRAILGAGLGLAAAALALAAGGAAAGGEVVEVEIRQYAFHPAEVVVKPGTVVRWVNRERRQYHSVWFEGLDPEEPEYFFPEETYERRFDRPGVYRYRCGPHPEMRGVVRVVD